MLLTHAIKLAIKEKRIILRSLRASGVSPNKRHVAYKEMLAAPAYVFHDEFILDGQDTIDITNSIEFPNKIFYIETNQFVALVQNQYTKETDTQYVGIEVFFQRTDSKLNYPLPVFGALRVSSVEKKNWDFIELGGYEISKNCEIENTIVRMVIYCINRIMNPRAIKETVHPKLKPFAKERKLGPIGWMYHTLSIASEATPRTAHQGGTHASPKWHIRRGHMRYLKKQDRYIKIPECEVGDRKRGGVLKDYNVQTKEPQP